MTNAERALNDLPPLRSSEARLSFLLRLSDALRRLDDAGDMQLVAARMLATELRADRIGYADLDAQDDQTTIRIDVEVGLRGSANVYADAAIVRDLSDRLGSGEIDVHGDVEASHLLSMAEKHAYAAAGIKAAVIVPLLDTGEVKAFFFLHHLEPRVFTEQEIDFLRETAERAWFAAEGARTKTALRDSEARLAAALESVPVGVAVVDTQGRIVLANSEYRQFLPSGLIPSRDPAGQHRWHAFDETGATLPLSDYPGARAMRGERTVPGQEMLFGIDEEHQRWTRVASVPIYDGHGRVSGQASVISDIDALKRLSEALLESEARAQFLIDGVTTASWEAAPDGLIEVDSPSWRAFTGQSYDDWKGRGWLSAIHPQDRAPTIQKWRETVRMRRTVDAEYRLRGKDGTYRWMNVRAVPLRDKTDRIVKWLGINIDIDDRKRLEESLEVGERRTRALVDGIPQLLWRSVHATEWNWASPQWTEFTGQCEKDSLGLGWLGMVHPDDRGTALSAWNNGEDAYGFEVEHRLRHHDGSYRWFVTRATPIRDDAGNVVEWLGTANDIDALRRARARQDVMVAELQHRTRNLIAVVRALSAKTLDRSVTLADFEKRFNDRLAALARVQGLLSHASAGRRVTFDELLRSELAALGAGDRDGLDARVTLKGPRGIPLRSSAVQTLALALHELATNAVKHGALSAKSGTLTVTWSIELDAVGRPDLFLEWEETGLLVPETDGSIVGYGRELIERALPFQLGAETHYDLSGDGLRCTIRVPIVHTPANGEEE